MSHEPVRTRHERRAYTPKPEIVSLLKVSGNPINGLGETEIRRPSPHFWHPPELHPWGELQIVARTNSRKCPGSVEAFAAAYQHPELIPVASQRSDISAGERSAEAMKFALAHEADDVGIAAMDPLYVFEGYRIDEPWVIVLALAHDYERLKHVPPAIASGVGELGKHGSIISRHFGAGVRLAAVTTDMPLVATGPDVFGADDFCKTCQICTRECPPGAIVEQKQMVRGVERWYVDFDKCIPYFAEAASCGICIAVCPWTRPEVRPKLLATTARRRS